MTKGLIACLDAYYYVDHAKACGVVFGIDPFEDIVSEYCVMIKPIQAYEPGRFYRRELPCLLALYRSISEKIDLIIVDGFVHLKNNEKGLGAHLFEALDGKTPIVGVAKTYYKGVSKYMEVFRGESKKPLYISSIGVDLSYSSKLIKNLNGNSRIPDVLKLVDGLTRVIN